MIPMPTLETRRLVIRPCAMDDLHPMHRLLDVELREAELGTVGAQTLPERAVVHKHTQQLIGACGFVPCLDTFEQLAALSPTPRPSSHWLSTPEFGLFYAITPAFQGQGYATEATQALVDYAFQHLRLKRIVATTTYENAASMGVMRKIGMRIERNPYPEPPWLQIVGVLENDAIPAGVILPTPT